MLWESSKMEQRYDAVLGVIRDGYTVTEVAQKFGVSRQSVHSWIKRYEVGGLEGLGEHTSRPVTSPTQLASRIEARAGATPPPPELGGGAPALPTRKRGRDARALGILGLSSAAPRRAHRAGVATKEVADL